MYPRLITVSWKVELGRGSYTANSAQLRGWHTRLVDSKLGSSRTITRLKSAYYKAEIAVIAITRFIASQSKSGRFFVGGQCLE